MHLISRSLFLCSLIIASLLFTQINAQVVTGRVIDAKTNLPIEFANISIVNEAIGTISNGSGQFAINIPSNMRNRELAISFIGYETKTFSISQLSSKLLVKLTPANITIEAVTVRPDSTMYTFLKKVYKKIPENYGKTSSLLTGFYRESTSDTNGQYLYIAEAVTESYKPSYKSSAPGQVKIIKSRMNKLTKADTVNNVPFYGGLFVAFNGDMVYDRAEMIKPSSFNKYNYEYVGMTEYNNEKVHAFSFESSNSNTNKKQKGNFYIDVNTLAYVYFSYDYSGQWSGSSPLLKHYSSNRKVLYTKVSNRWVIKSVTGERYSLNKSTGKCFTLKYEYVTTNVTDTNVTPIGLEDQIKYTDIFTYLANDYDKSFWTDYNIIEQDSVANIIFNNPGNKVAAEEFLTKEFNGKECTGIQRFHKITSKLDGGMGVFYNAFSFPIQNATVNFKDNILTQDDLPGNEIIWGYNLLFGYMLNKKSSVFYSGESSLSKSNYLRRNTLGFEYKLALKKGGRQVFLLPQLGYYWGYAGVLLGQMHFTEETNVSGKSFKEGAVNVYSGKKYHGMNAGIMFLTPIGERVNLLAGANYQIPFKTNTLLLFEQKKGLFPKKAYQPLNSAIEYYEGGELKTQSSFELNNWSFQLGLRFVF
jgi:hypothetical protein